MSMKQASLVPSPGHQSLPRLLQATRRRKRGALHPLAPVRRRMARDQEAPPEGNRLRHQEVRRVLLRRPPPRKSRVPLDDGTKSEDFKAADGSQRFLLIGMQAAHQRAGLAFLRYK